MIGQASRADESRRELVFRLQTQASYPRDVLSSPLFRSLGPLAQRVDSVEKNDFRDYQAPSLCGEEVSDLNSNYAAE